MRAWAHMRTVPVSLTSPPASSIESVHFHALPATSVASAFAVRMVVMMVLSPGFLRILAVASSASLAVRVRLAVTVARAGVPILIGRGLVRR